MTNIQEKYDITYEQLVRKVSDRLTVNEEGHWQWTGALSGKPGVPMMWYKGVSFNVRRALYELFYNREIQPGERLYANEGHRLNINPAQQDCLYTHASARDDLNGRQKARLKEILKEVVVNHENGCHEFQGRLTKAGYPQVIIRGKGYYLHRTSWEFYNDRSVPPKMVIAHRCNNPACVNPQHLYLTDQAGNLQQMDQEGRRRAKVTTVLKADQVKHIILTYLDGEPLAYKRAHDYALECGVSKHGFCNVIYAYSWGKVWNELEHAGLVKPEDNPKSPLYAGRRETRHKSRMSTISGKYKCEEAFDPQLPKEDNIAAFIQLGVKPNTAYSYYYDIAKAHNERS